jgi:hypothetical protein
VGSEAVVNIGERVTIIDEISPRYLAGAVVEVTSLTGRGGRGKIVSFRFTPPENGRFRVGGSIRFNDTHINREIQPPQHNGKPAPRIILLTVLLEIVKANGMVMLNDDDLAAALADRGMTMDTAFTYDAQP